MTAGMRTAAWRPPVEGIQEVLHAQLLGHSYPMHTHDSWTTRHFKRVLGVSPGRYADRVRGAAQVPDTAPGRAAARSAFALRW